jgi:Family of unknown function (DUF6493)
MTLPVGDLVAAIERNDGQAVARYLKSSTEAERRAASPKVRAVCGRIWDFHGDRSATVVAILGTAAGVRQVAQVIGPLGVEHWTDEAIAVLRERNPAWLPDLPRALLTGNEFRNCWRFVRALVRAGLVSKPDVPEYITLMPTGLAGLAVGGPGRHLVKSIEEQLLEDPELLEDEVFRLFSVEGSARGLYWADGWVSPGRVWEEGKWINRPPRPEVTWRATLARMARRGLIDFDRLLDESIAVFLRDLRPSHFGWYVGMHDELAPTLDEMAARAAQYERLLAASTSLGAGVGQRALEQLFRADRLDLESLARASRPALSRGEKGIVVKQLKLLEQAMKRRPELAPLVREVVSSALGHERPEIGEAARALLKRLPGGPPQKPQPTDQASAPQAAAGGSAIIERAEGLLDDPEWGPSISSLLGALREGAPPQVWKVRAGGGKALPPPITDPEEVVEAFTRLVEKPDDPIGVERAIAGAVRTARIPLAKRSRVSAPLAKRAAERLPGWPSGLTSANVASMVASVAYTWSTGQKVAAGFGDSTSIDFAVRHSSLDRELKPATPTGVLAVRCIEAIELIAAGRATELLSEPTHERGAVAAAAFIDRAQRNFASLLGSNPPTYDLQTAALRLRPEDSDVVLARTPRRVKEPIAKLLRQLPTDAVAEIVGSTPANPWGNTAKVVVLARIAPAGGRSTVLNVLTNLADPSSNYFRLTAEGEFETGYGSAIKTWPLIAPWLPELTAAHLLRPLSRALSTGKHDWGPAAIACLLHPDTALGRVGHLALAMACVGAEGDTRTAAGDVFAAAAKDGRLQPGLMATAWVELVRHGAFQAKRLESTLRPVSASPASGLRMAQTFQLALGHLIAAGVRDLHGLVRLACDVGRTSGVFPDDLGSAKGGTELAGALRALAEARSSDGAGTKAAGLELLEGLLVRADR